MFVRFLVSYSIKTKIRRQDDVLRLLWLYSVKREG